MGFPRSLKNGRLNQKEMEGWSKIFFRKGISWLLRELCSGKTRRRRPLFFLEDNTGAKIGYTYQDGEDQVLIDLKGNIFKVSRKTTIKQATRILLKRLQEG